MKRWIPLFTALAALAVVPQFVLSSELGALTFSISSICLFLWISEVVPPFVPTLLLWAAIPILLGRFGPAFGLQNVLSWAADPVIALFFGGFVLGAAAEKSGLAARLMELAVRKAGDSYLILLLLVILITAFLSMWMSNIAAAALVFACLHPLVAEREPDDIFRRLLLVGAALGADLGGIATPIGTGPNAIAIAAVSGIKPISFLSWMVFAVPLTVGMTAVGYLLLARRIPREAGAWTSGSASSYSDERSASKPRSLGRRFMIILAATILLWLTEPLHGVPAGVIALAAAFVIFASGSLKKEDLFRIDWSTLLLIAGGITLGRLLEQSGIIKSLVSQVSTNDLNPFLSLFLLYLLSAVLSALMSNTATAILLIPPAMALFPYPSTAILIAVAASFGIPLLISTPPNAMAFGQGGIRFGDLFWPGIILMIGGCVLIALTGRPILNLVGIE